MCLEHARPWDITRQPACLDWTPAPLLSSGCLRGSLELCPACDPRFNSTRPRSRAPVLFGTHRGYRSVSRTPLAYAAARRTVQQARTSARASMSVWCRVLPAPISKPESELQGRRSSLRRCRHRPREHGTFGCRGGRILSIDSGGLMSVGRHSYLVYRPGCKRAVPSRSSMSTPKWLPGMGSRPWKTTCQVASDPRQENLTTGDSYRCSS